MQTIYLVNRFLRQTILIFLCLVSSPVFANTKYSFFTDGNKLYILSSSKPNNKFIVPLTSEYVNWVVVDSFNRIGNDTYFAIFQREPSNPEQPEGFCGSGVELWLHVYRMNANGIDLVGNVLAGSCKQSFSMASLESGFPNSDKDYSSFRWNNFGFSLEWFSKKDERGNNIPKTFYSIKGNSICIER
ncbi:hypothetical protein ACHHY8_24575 [Enterobacter cloacae complex sp. 2024EL-00215]|uniref:hypothetical protein n=1 Tax=unclassified Enterobacter cloacae complex TaxID=2757714 RepID=UPI0037507414